jgi:hypothetical protein
MRMADSIHTAARLAPPSAATITTASAAFKARTTHGTLFARTSFINGQITTAEVLTMQSRDSLLGIFGTFHRHEAEATGTTGHFIHDQVHVRDRPIGCKQILKIIFCRAERQITNKQFCTHLTN